VLVGSAGANQLFGLAGADILSGGDGDDLLAGGGGADQLRGGTGIDTVDYSGSASGVSVALSLSTTPNAGAQQASTFNGVANGDAAGDILVNDIENITGSAFADSLRGNQFANVLRSGASNAAGETLRGGDGADILIADGATAAGAPRLLLGENGTDTYRVLDGFNIIQGYATGERIELDAAAAETSVLSNGGNWYLRLDGDTAAGGASGTETWVLLGATASMSAQAADTAAATVLQYVFVDTTLT
jgi:Ca2+-binding RTX toxin-like protein